MRRRRTIYFNDARHYYLFVHEPPMRLVDAWGPVDEVAGTGIDTFAYGVARDDGLFYPSRVGRRFGEDRVGRFQQSAYWRVWHNMQSLIARGLDPLAVLVDRAHERGLEFIASLRMGGYPGLPEELSVKAGGRGMAEERVRDFQFRLLEELATEYDTDGVELDFAAAPGGTSFWFPPDDAPALAPEMTGFVRSLRERLQDSVIGARVYPTRELNDRAGLEVERWLEEGLVDYVVPLVYAYFVLDADMPIGWLVEAAHAAEVSAYAMLQPYYLDESRALTSRQYPSPAMFRAAAANAWQLGVDGLYTWFMAWPLGDEQRAVLTELADPRQVVEGDKHYFLRRGSQAGGDFDYPAHLPLRIDPATDLGRTFEVPFTIADDVTAEGSHAAAVRLHLAFTDLTASDRLELRLNGERLTGERVRRRPLRQVDPYSGQWLDVDLDRVWPVQGRNRLEVALLSRPAGLSVPVTLEDVEVTVTYDTYAAGSLGGAAE